MALSVRKKLITITPIVLYWPAVFIASHIPFPQWAVQTKVTDKSLHYFAYLILVFLLWFAVNPWKKANWRKPAAWWVLFVVVLYGVLDEWLQSFVGRNVDIKDFFASLTGSITGLVLLSIFPFWPAALILTGSTIFVLTNFVQAIGVGRLFVINILFHVCGYGIFTFLWLRYLPDLLPLKPPEVRWLIGVFIMPILLLTVVELFSAIANNEFNIWGTKVSFGAITVVVGVNYLAALIIKPSG